MNQVLNETITKKEGYRTLFVPLYVLAELNFQDDKGNRIRIPIKNNNHEFLEGVMLVYNSPKPLKATKTPYVEIYIPENNVFKSGEEAERYQRERLNQVNSVGNNPEIYTPME